MMYENSPSMKKNLNFKDVYVKRITRMLKPYDEERIIFDCYDICQSLKQHEGQASTEKGDGVSDPWRDGHG